MRKISYLFAAILMSVLGLTGRAETTTVDFASAFSVGGTANMQLICPDGWQYTGGLGSALKSNNTWPAGQGVFFGTGTTGYLITDAKAGKITLKVGIPAPVAAAANGAFISVSTMNGTTVSAELKKWSYGEGLDDTALMNYVTLEMDLEADGTIGITGKNICLNEYTNTPAAGGGGGGGGEMTDTYNFTGLKGGTLAALLQSGTFPEGAYVYDTATPTSNYCYYPTSSAGGELRGGSPANAEKAYVITYAKKGTYTVYIRAYSASYIHDTRAPLRLFSITGEPGSWGVGELIKGYQYLDEANPSMNNTDYLPVTFEIAEDGWVGLQFPNAAINRVVNTYYVEGEAELYTVSGTVKNDDGNPMAGVEVAISSLKATTAEDGTYSIADVPAGDYKIAVKVDGYENYSQDITVSADLTHDITLKAMVTGAKFQLKNINFSNMIIKDAVLTLSFGETVLQENITADADGFYTVTIKGAMTDDDKYTVTAVAPNYETRTLTLSTGWVSANAGFKLVYGGIMEGISASMTGKKVGYTVTVVDNNQEYVTDATVYLTYADETKNATNKLDGTYTLVNLDAPILAINEATLHVSVPGMKPIADQVIEFTGENKEITVTAYHYEPTTFTGTVMKADSDQEIVGATVVLLDGEEEVATATTDDYGDYELSLDGEVKESYTLKVTAPYYDEATKAVTDIEREGYYTYNMMLQPTMYTFTATVANEQSEAIEGAKVVMNEQELTTDEHGNFVASIWAGDAADGAEFTATAEAYGYVSEEYTFSFAADETAKEYSFQLKERELIFTATVNDDFFGTIDNATVVVTSAAGEKMSVLNEGEGKYVFATTVLSCPEGKFTVDVTCEDYIAQSGEFDFAESDEVNMTFILIEEDRVLTVTVVDAESNEALAGAIVKVTYDGTEELPVETTAEPGVFIAQAGAASARGIEFTVTVTCEGYQDAEAFTFKFDDGNVAKTIKLTKATGINTIFAGQNGAVNAAGKIYVNGEAHIFTIDGKLVRVVRTQEAEEVTGLTPGIYIVQGQKMIVK